MGLTKKYMFPYGVFKLLEWFCLLIAWSTVTGYPSDPPFHMVICIIAWLIVTVDFIANICHQCHKLTFSNKHIIIGAFYVFLALLVLIAACTFVSEISTMKNSSTFKCGGAFGIISAGILTVDGILVIIHSEQLMYNECNEDELSVAILHKLYGT